MRNALVGGSRKGDIEKIIENILYNHLIRMGYEVTVGQLQAGEIDFVCSKKGGSRLYVQASYIIANEKTRKREFGNLESIKDNYPKFVISMTPLVRRNDDNGITHLSLRTFLMSEELWKIIHQQSSSSSPVSFNRTAFLTGSTSSRHQRSR